MAYPASNAGHEHKWYTRAQAAADTQFPQPCLVALFSYSYVECPILVYGLRQALGPCNLQHGDSVQPKQAIYARNVDPKRGLKAISTLQLVFITSNLIVVTVLA